MDKKVELLQKNKLDQIIICCIIACLSLNEDKYYEALGSIFAKYTFAPKQPVADMTCPGGDDANLLDYYNLTFLPSVEDMLDKQNPEFTLSPVRKGSLPKYKEGKFSLPPISKMFSGNPFEAARPSIRLGGSTSGDYQKKYYIFKIGHLTC